MAPKIRHGIVLAWVSILFANAQDIEVRRALPVPAKEWNDYQNPAWMDKVVTEPEVRRAVPVPKATIQPTPTPAPSITPPAPVISATPTQVEESSNIRIAPNSSANVSALERANQFYSRKDYDLAIPEYERFLISDSSAPGRDGALFRLAECHRMAGNPPAARAGYQKLVTEFHSGEFAAAGAYRLGEILLDEKQFEPASIQFDLASREAKDAEIRLSAAYFAARSLDAMKKDDLAEERYRTVMVTQGNNPYRESAAMALVAIQLRNRKKQAALAGLENFLETAPASDTSSAAALQAATLAKELGQRDVAIKFYEKAATSADPAIRAEARLGALRLRYESGEWDRIASQGSAMVSELPESNRAEALQIIGAALRKVGKEAEARRIYDRLLKEYPAAANSDILYQRLLTLYASKDKSLPAEVDAFLKASKDPRQSASASLLKAETLFDQGDYAAAAQAYAPLGKNELLKKEQRTAALYKYAWSLAASGDNNGAIAAYTTFIDQFSNDQLASSAVLQRGLARQKTQAFVESIADFNLICSQYPYSKEVELALLQKALTYGQQKNYSAMTAAFQELLEKFPNTAAAAQAYFWLGWAAFENKNYNDAIKFLDKSRLLDSKNYGERAGVRILLAYYQLQNRGDALRESDSCRQIPLEVAIWLAQGCLDDKKPAKAEKLLLPLVQQSSTAPQALSLLAESELALGKFKSAKEHALKYLDTPTDPLSQSKAQLIRAKACLALKQYAEARDAAQQTMQLQPEGPLNAEARMVMGDVAYAEGDFESAARAFMTVGLLTEDPILTPNALKRANESYRRAGKDADADKAIKEIHDRFPDSAAM
jgi:TolA-binding protein